MKRISQASRLGRRVGLAGLSPVLCLSLALGATARAGDTGISVLGTGEVRALPDLVEIHLRPTATAELAGDAIVKYRDALRRSISAFEALKMPHLEVASRELSFQQVSAGGNALNVAAVAGVAGGAAAAKGQVQIARGLQLRLRNIGQLSEQELIEHIARLLDTAKDAGVAPSHGGNDNLAMVRMMISSGMAQTTSAVQFVLTDVAQHRRPAYQQAFESAKANAQRLADLSGVRLGRVLSVAEVPVTAPEKDDAGGLQMKVITAIYGGAGASEPAEISPAEIRSDTYQEIPVRIGLRVRFAIEGKE